MIFIQGGTPHEYRIIWENKTVADGITVAELIAQEQLETPEHVKVAVNDDFVEREQFADTRLHDGDVVEFLTFMGGGCR